MLMCVDIINDDLFGGILLYISENSYIPISLKITANIGDSHISRENSSSRTSDRNAHDTYLSVVNFPSTNTPSMIKTNTGINVKFN